MGWGESLRSGANFKFAEVRLIEMTLVLVSMTRKLRYEHFIVNENTMAFVSQFILIYGQFKIKDIWLLAPRSVVKSVLSGVWGILNVPVSVQTCQVTALIWGNSK